MYFLKIIFYGPTRCTHHDSCLGQTWCKLAENSRECVAQLQLPSWLLQYDISQNSGCATVKISFATRDPNDILISSMNIFSPDCVRACYFTNWAVNRTAPADQVPEDIDGNLCNIAIYSFANMIDNELVPWEEWDEDL